MEEPEKIYVKIIHPISDEYTEIIAFEHEDGVEYIRKDVFIEMAAIWFNNNFMVHDEYGVISDSFDTKEEMFEDFKNYMKGE
jgi:hypothetical protein